jgi:hypothetical protein
MCHRWVGLTWWVDRQAEEIARLKQQVAKLQAENERPRRRVESLLQALEEAQRVGKRQLASFSRQEPKAHPAQPGRAAGASHRRCCHRWIPEQIDATVEAELPACCPHCGGQLTEVGRQEQHQTEIPEPRVERIYFRIQVGQCARLRTVSPRPPCQASLPSPTKQVLLACSGSSLHRKKMRRWSG